MSTKHLLYSIFYIFKDWALLHIHQRRGRPTLRTPVVKREPPQYSKDRRKVGGSQGLRRYSEGLLHCNQFGMKIISKNLIKKTSKKNRTFLAGCSWFHSPAPQEYTNYEADKAQTENQKP
jgi:hypothetical protein